jgi:hypothetical protein
MSLAINPFIALGVLASASVTDAAYVFFNAAVTSRRRVWAANWSAIWYLLSAFAVISYTENALYVALLLARRFWVGDLASSQAKAGAAASRPAMTIARSRLCHGLFPRRCAMMEIREPSDGDVVIAVLHRIAARLRPH